MGYSHYYYRPKTLGTPKKFQQFANDCQKIFDYCQNELGIKLANGIADKGSEPIANSEEISFNGSDEQPVGQWTTEEDIMIPWPSKEASLNEMITDPSASKVAGNWFAGHTLAQRTAPLNNLSGLGEGSYETLAIERVFHPQSWQKPKGGLYFECCKTAYRPYDLTVTAVLIALKHHFPKVEIRTDGEEKDWLDGRFLCNQLFGYGLETKIGD